jgi:hypothetical protein
VSSRVPEYAAKWHRVYEWAKSAPPGDLTYYFPPPPSIRTAGWRGTWVYDPQDNEEAAERGIFLAELGDIPIGPDGDHGGRRRVSIRFHTWVIDDLGAHDPRWVTTGWGMTARSASQVHRRWIREYRDDVAHHVESRRLVATEMEIVWWTAGPDSEYL